MQRAPPTVEETEKADTVTATLQVQKIPTTGKADDCNTLLDSGSNVALVEAEFAKKSGWKATEVNLEMQAAEKRAEIFKTRTHCVELINKTGKIEEVVAYEMQGAHLCWARWMKEISSCQELIRKSSTLSNSTQRPSR